MSLVNATKLIDAVAAMVQGLSEEEANKLVYLDAFLAEEFSRRAARPYEYKLTAAYAKILSRGNGGLMYPSVEIRGGINLAVTARVFDDNFEVLATDVHEVGAYYGYGVYDLILRRSSCEFEKDGRIIWDSKKSLSFTHSLQGGKQLLHDVEGWRVPKQQGAGIL